MSNNKGYSQIMLSDTKAKRAKSREKVYRIADGKGLALEIRPSSHKFWRYRYRLDGKASMFTIGEYPEVSLKEARNDLEKVRALVAKGVHPTQHHKQLRREQAVARENTFQAVAEEWQAKQRGHWSDSYAGQMKSALENHVFPTIGAIPLNEVSAADVLEVLKVAESRGATRVAVLIRQWCSSVFCYGVSMLRCDYDPTVALKGAIRAPKARHHQPLSKDDIGGLLAEIGAY
ncbi:MAG: integrase arm-type DNA-binding domain-containing protein, partial [Gammaproteobacteria bacterium]|nr:integrase arm-type DNA-binding domain-containing protein [Gammaproteobacteria bacterium]